jgi:hypothetical protein
MNLVPDDFDPDFKQLFSDPEKAPLVCDVCFCGEFQYDTPEAQAFGAEGSYVRMYWCDREEMTVCENCKCLILSKEAMHNWKEQGF